MKRKLVAASFAAALATAAAVAPAAGALAAGGGITTQCTNPGGQTVHGQCNGSALTETNVNPAGHAPPGQNK